MENSEEMVWKEISGIKALITMCEGDIIAADCEETTTMANLTMKVL